jgi:hypothetical protein
MQEIELRIPVELTAARIERRAPSISEEVVHRDGGRIARHCSKAAKRRPLEEEIKR